MVNKIGHAQRVGNTLIFDKTGWAMVKEAAKRAKKSPVQIVNVALRRFVRSQRGQKS